MSKTNEPAGAGRGPLVTFPPGTRYAEVWMTTGDELVAMTSEGYCAPDGRKFSQEREFALSRRFFGSREGSWLTEEEFRALAQVWAAGKSAAN